MGKSLVSCFFDSRCRCNAKPVGSWSTVDLVYYTYAAWSYVGGAALANLMCTTYTVGTISVFPMHGRRHPLENTVVRLWARLRSRRVYAVKVVKRERYEQGLQLPCIVL